MAEFESAQEAEKAFAHTEGNQHFVRIIMTWINVSCEHSWHIIAHSRGAGLEMSQATEWEQEKTKNTKIEKIQTMEIYDAHCSISHVVRERSVGENDKKWFDDRGC